MTLRSAILVAILSLPALASNCNLQGNYIFCNGHLASNAETAALLPAPYRDSNVETVIPRDSRGRIKRSGSARHQFMQDSPCPANGNTKGRCPGYIIDHVMPLACGGADAVGNLQWQTVADAKAKDRWELKQCGK